MAERRSLPGTRRPSLAFSLSPTSSTLAINLPGTPETRGQATSEHSLSFTPFDHKRCTVDVPRQGQEPSTRDVEANGSHGLLRERGRLDPRDQSRRDALHLVEVAPEHRLVLRPVHHVREGVTLGVDVESFSGGWSLRGVRGDAGQKLPRSLGQTLSDRSDRR